MLDAEKVKHRSNNKKLFWREKEMKSIKNNGILVRISLIRPFARESTKKINHPGAFFYLQDNYQKKI